VCSLKQTHRSVETTGRETINIVVDTIEEEKALFPERAGDRLRAARAKAGLDLSDVASRTRIPLRHLQAIEAGDYSSFPSPTYCIGFVKAYARAVDEDEQELAQQLRTELGDEAHGYRTELQDYDDADPARIPSRTLAWTAATIALLLAVGYGVWRSLLMSGPEVSPTPVETVVPAPQAPVAATTAAPTSSEVVLTAIEPVWVRIYDASDKVLFEKEMAKGERYLVPADADNPRIRTGRAQLIAVTINGSAVPALGPAERTVKDVGISAAALVARTATPVTQPEPAKTEQEAPGKPKPAADRKPSGSTGTPVRTPAPRTTTAAPAATPQALETGAPAPANETVPPEPQP
jgi:transcriptional regulator with XRE-family HTH domain